MNAIEQLRAKLMAEKSTGTRPNYSEASNQVFPHWNAPNNSTTTVRFLPSIDNTELAFWKERQIINIPFATVEGHPELTNVIVQVPCVKMYDSKERCPINDATREFWGTDKEDIARTYWPKKSYLYQGFVVSSELDEKETPDNPIRRFIISKSIHSIIEASLLDPEMDSLPTDYDNGIDFRIIKTQGSQYANYNTSTFARKPRPLTQEERSAIETHGLYDFNDFLPRRPDANMMQVITEMFEESLKGDYSVYRLEWSEFYTPRDVQLKNTGGTQQRSTPQSVQATPQAQVHAQESVAEAPQASAGGVDDIMAQIRSRINNG